MSKTIHDPMPEKQRNVCVHMRDKCRLLTKQFCATQPTCVFFATAEQQYVSYKCANARLATLPQAQQLHISQKYFNGEFPWLRKPKQKPAPKESYIGVFDEMHKER